MMMVLLVLLGVLVCRRISYAAAATDLTEVLTSWHACNDFSDAPLYCIGNSTYSRIDFTTSFKLSTPGDIVFEKQWTVLPKRNQDGFGGDTLTALDRCVGTCVSMINNRTTITMRVHRPRIAYPLVEVDTFTDHYVPYGLWFSNTPSTSSTENVTSWLSNPSLLTPGFSCTGYSADLSNGDACYPQNPPNITTLAATVPSMCGLYYDVTHIDQSKWISYPLGQCKAAVCNSCGSGNTTTVARAFPFGVQCRVFAVAQPTYFLDVSFVTKSGTGITEAVYTSSEIGGNGMRRSLTQYSRASITNVKFGSGYTAIPPSSAAGGTVVICSKNVQDLAALDQGFINPWIRYPDKGAGGVPTTNYLGGDLMWYYLGATESMRLLGFDCAQAGGLGPVTNIYDNANETQAGCASGAIQAGACVPGLVNATFSPCQTASTLNEFTLLYNAAVTDADRTLLVAPFLPPAWNTSAPNMWIHTRDGEGIYLMQQTRSLTQPIPIEMNLRYEVSNDILLAGVAGGGILYDALKSRCVYSGSSDAGIQQIRVCNIGAEQQRVRVEVSECQHIKNSNKSTDSSFAFNETLLLKTGYTLANPDNCATTSVVPFVFDEHYFPIGPNDTQLPTFFGRCAVNVWNANRTIKLADAETLRCFYLPFKPLFAAPETPSKTCVFLEFNCWPSWLALALIIAGVIALVVIIVVVTKYKTDSSKENDIQTHTDMNVYQYESLANARPYVPLVSTYDVRPRV